MEVAEELVRLHELGIKGKLGEDDLKVRTKLPPTNHNMGNFTLPSTLYTQGRMAPRVLKAL